MTERYTVAVYLAQLGYGGPEEGGWYYECGELVRASKKTLPDYDAACEYSNRLNQRLARTLNKGRRPISSVLSDGVYRARVTDGTPEPIYPTERPYYS